MAKSRHAWGEGDITRLPNGRARVRWRENGRRRSRNFPNYQLAEVFRRGVIGDIARERAGLGPDPSTFADLETDAQAWLDRRRHTHRSWSDDRGRWNRHLSATFGKLRPAEVDLARIRAFVERQRRDGMNPDTLRLCVACLSSLFADLCERPRETGVERNPCKGLPKNLRRLLKSATDPRFTPYVERLADVRRLYQAMPTPQRVAYAIGVCAGLRPGEILGLEWSHVQERERRIDVRQQVQDGKLGPLKDDEARIVQGPFLAPLVPLLEAWRLKTGGRGLLFPPRLTAAKGRRVGAFMHPKRLTEAVEAAAKECELPAIMEWAKPWYQATRHTFATHWMKAGHSLGELALVLGHSSTWVTERYAHIRPSAERDDDPWTLDLEAKPAKVVAIGTRPGPASRRGARKR
jgi:integrase